MENGCWHSEKHNRPVAFSALEFTCNLWAGSTEMFLVYELASGRHYGQRQGDPGSLSYISAPLMADVKWESGGRGE